VVSYRVMLDVPRELVLFVSGLLAARRREIGTRKGTRKLGCYRQALFGLAWFRDKGDIPRLGAGFGLARWCSGDVARPLAEPSASCSSQCPRFHSGQSVLHARSGHRPAVDLELIAGPGAPGRAPLAATRLAGRPPPAQPPSSGQPGPAGEEHSSWRRERARR